jgi:hypothetical protein
MWQLENSQKIHICSRFEIYFCQIAKFSQKNRKPVRLMSLGGDGCSHVCWSLFACCLETELIACRLYAGGAA